jgi:hypothetical protein
MLERFKPNFSKGSSVFSYSPLNGAAARKCWGLDSRMDFCLAVVRLSTTGRDLLRRPVRESTSGISKHGGWAGRLYAFWEVL